MSSISDMMKKQRTQEKDAPPASVRETFREAERKAVLIRVPVGIHQGLKVKAATEGTTINELVLGALLAQYPEIDS